MTGDDYRDHIAALEADAADLARQLATADEQLDALDLLRRSMEWEAFGLAVGAAHTGDRILFAEAAALNAAAERIAKVLRS